MVITAIEPASDLGDFDVHGFEDAANLRRSDFDAVAAQRVREVSTAPHRDQIVFVLLRGRDRRESDAFVVAAIAH